jgi:hypothetical protein
VINKQSRLKIKKKDKNAINSNKENRYRDYMGLIKYFWDLKIIDNKSITGVYLTGKNYKNNNLGYYSIFERVREESYRSEIL